MLNAKTPAQPDVVCLSHLRWNFVYQRPQHLMARFARDRRVFFVEEPLFDTDEARLDSHLVDGVEVIVPRLPSMRQPEAARVIRGLLRGLFAARIVNAPLVWLYTPMALQLLGDLEPAAIIYDCMDELSGFANAPAELRDRERALFACADLVFTGGHSLYQAKRNSHHNIYPIPSSVDVAHFARRGQETPADQAPIARPRIGFAGVIDERMDIGLVDAVSAAHPDWQFILVGPVVKINPARLPQRANLHYLGMKSYQDLPAYLAGWDVAILPFAHNDATRYISPTKTPEYLAAGCPVVSTSIRDVVRPYGEQGLVQIADRPAAFGRAIAKALTPEGRAAIERAQPLLRSMSWDHTFDTMRAHVDALFHDRPAAAARRRAAGSERRTGPEAALGAATS